MLPWWPGCVPAQFGQNTDHRISDCLAHPSKAAEFRSTGFTIMFRVRSEGILGFIEMRTETLRAADAHNASGYVRQGALRHEHADHRLVEMHSVNRDSGEGFVFDNRTAIFARDMHMDALLLASANGPEKRRV